LSIEIWNLVFIQFNANPDGSLTPLAAKHVDTGMGFERVTSMIQCTNGFKDFTARISNYETDVFSPIFRELEKLSGKKYTSTLPSDNVGEQGKIDIAFRVIADHIRCLSFAIADGIQPSNEGRGYVLRRILRRAIRYGRTLGFHEPFFYELVDVVADNFGGVFPELRERKQAITTTLRAEEESFNRTLDRGLEQFNKYVDVSYGPKSPGVPQPERPIVDVVAGDEAFVLYDTFGFPLDLTELLARERRFTVDVLGFEKLMEQQRQRAREDHQKKKSVISVATENLNVEPTKFLGYDNLEVEAVVEAVSPGAEKTFDVILDKTPFYAEMGGQVGDTGLIGSAKVLDTQKQGNVYVHRSAAPLEQGQKVRASVDVSRRSNIQRHHTVTHLFHWALHEVVSKDARQKGSLVAPDRFRFDFNQPEKLSDQQIADIEKLVNERIKENATVHWFEMPFAEVRGKPNIMQFFGDKYGDIVRIVQVGGHDKALDGFSMELCGGTHTKTTGEIGLFKIMRESAVAAGIRRVEAVCGQFAQEFIAKQGDQEKAEIEKAKARELEKELAKQRQAAVESQAPAIAEQLLAKLQGKLLVSNLGDANADLLRAIINAVKPKLTSGVVVLGGVADSKVSLICLVTPDLVKEGKNAGKIVGELAKICGGGGGGKPDLAQAGGKQPEKLSDALSAAPKIIGS
jgi:alanyl-tRNA synthetase